MSQETFATQSSFQRVTQDLLDLFELQVELLSVDSQVAKQKLKTAVTCGAIAATLAGSGLTVTMIGLGVLLDEMTDLSTGGALLVVGAVSFAVVVVLGWLALSAIGKAASAMSESKSEFAESLRWVKATLIAPKTSPRNQIRRDSFDKYESVSARPSGWNGTNSADREPTPTHRS